MAKTAIEWTDQTWNPIAGCSDVSEGCRNCYARGMARRLVAMGSAKYAGLTVMRGSHVVWTGEINFDEKAMLVPLRRKTPTRYFVNSMSDLFHENVLRSWLVDVWAVMMLCPRHTFQILTKRPERALEILTEPGFRSTVMQAASALAFDIESKAELKSIRFPANAVLVDDDGPDGDEYNVRIRCKWPLPNVWLGVSVENQKTADERIPLLWQTPAAVRFLSCEPLLGPISLDDAFYTRPGIDKGRRNAIHWVIAGGESGPHARPMHPDWARGLRDQCVAADVPFFFKQWGEWFGFTGEWTPSAKGDGHELHWPEDRTFTSRMKVQGWEGGASVCTGKKAAGHLLDGKEWRQFPEVAR